jgi:predicted ChrR family anti-sigma factor
MRAIEPDIESLGAMAAGTLDPAIRLILRARATVDPETSPRLHEANLIGSAFFETTEEVALASGALEEVMQRIDAEDFSHAQIELPSYLDGACCELRYTVQKTLCTSDWQTDAPGFRYIKLQVSESTIERNGGGVYLVELDAGCKVENHRHLGEEYTLVLKGAVEGLGEGAAAQVGSFVHRKNGSTHQPRAAIGSDCAVLVVMAAGLEPVPFESGLVSVLAFSHLHEPFHSYLSMLAAI